MFPSASSARPTCSAIAAAVAPLARLAWTVFVLCTWATTAEGPRELVLRAPLSTVALADGEWPESPVRLRCDLEVPGDAPTDLGLGAFVTDRDGTWFQVLHPQPLAPGRHSLTFDLRPGEALVGEPHLGAWDPPAVAQMHRAGIFLWSASEARSVIRIHRLELQQQRRPTGSAQALLTGLELPGLRADGNSIAARSGLRWTLSCRPDPLPDNPYDHEAFELLLEVERPDGQTETIRGAWRLPHHLHDEGWRERAEPAAAGRFELRYRPRLPGRHRLQLLARWQDGATLHQELPPLDVSGEAWDGYVRVDPVDPRFLATDFHLPEGPRLWWTTGLNLRSVNDPRGHDRVGSRFSPDRGLHAYRAYLRRLAAAGAGAAEIWMSSWNLAFEWREDWPGFHGIGRYHQGNAERLDELLDLADELGLRLKLVIYNHGMASTQADREWQNNPWNARLEESQADQRGEARPGPVRSAPEFFTHPEALAGQERLRRYLVARYADHPALLAWKLWSEINLTASRRPDRARWHREAARRWAELDPYDRPVTTHWSGDWRMPLQDQPILQDPAIDFLCIDAYHRGRLLADLLAEAMDPNQRNGLLRFGKPVIVTEFGGNWDAAPIPQLLAEHSSAPWVALVSGYGAGPMLWWFEWVDQNELWQPFGAVMRFIDGEDLRSTGPLDRPGTLTRQASSEHGALWCRAWSRRGRMLGYLLDPDWGRNGTTTRQHEQARIVAGPSVAAGSLALSWWDADLGQVRDTRRWWHPGGALELEAPPFRHHLAFKMWREEAVTPHSGDAQAGNPDQVDTP